MRKINISNAKKRNAILGFEAKPSRSTISQVLKDGTLKKSIKVLKSTLQTDVVALAERFGGVENLSQEIISSDVECDIETTGMMVDATNKIYANSGNNIVFNVKVLEVLKDKDGNETSRKPLVQKDANVSIDSMPVSWSGKFISKMAAVKKFAFLKHYQIKHVNGLTYDFLYDMAKELEDKDSLMFVGAGEKGNEPLMLVSGGTAYRGFLEGRVKGDQYCLILHLTNLELKEFTK